MNFLAGLRYEFRMHLRSLVFWVAVALVVMMVYSEVIVELGQLSGQLERARENPDLLRYSIETASGPGKAKLQQIADMAEHGPSPEYYEDMAGILADRMSISLSFAALFVAGFAPQRDRAARNREIVYSTPVSSFRYVLQQYLGAVGSLFLIAFLGFAISLFQFWRVQSQVGGTWTLSMFAKPLGMMLAPTVAYSAALLLCASVVIGKATSLVPLYFLYFFTTFRLVKIGDEVRYPLNLGTFIVRWEGHGTALFGPEYPVLLSNRMLYLTLTVLLLVVTTLVYEHRRSAFSTEEAA